MKTKSCILSPKIVTSSWLYCNKKKPTVFVVNEHAFKEIELRLYAKRDGATRRLSRFLLLSFINIREKHFSHLLAFSTDMTIGDVVCISNLLPFASFLTLFIELMTTFYFDGMTAKTSNFEILVLRLIVEMPRPTEKWWKGKAKLCFNIQAVCFVWKFRECLKQTCISYVCQDIKTVNTR